MMQFMPADFEVPFFAIEGVGGIVVKSADGFHDGGAAAHRSREADRIAPGDLRPSFMQAALVEKHHLELMNFMFFDIARVGCAASSQQRDGRTGEEHHGAQPGP